MEKEFVPYELSVKLKALGFDEDVFEWFNTETKDLCDVMKEVKAPLYQQAFRWFREKYGLRISNYIFVNMSGGISEGFTIFKYSKDTICRVESLTYEEAELACLTKLIELVEQTKN